MSFRGKLSLFFVVIVMIPMIVVGVLVVQITEDSRDGMADARVDAGLETAGALYDDALADASARAKQVAAGQIAEALASSDRESLQGLAEAALTDGVVSVTITAPGGEELAAAGPATGLAGAETSVSSGDGSLGAVRVTTLRAQSFLSRMDDLTTQELALATRDGVLAATTDLGDAELPAVGAGGATLTLAGEDEREFRAATLGLDGGPPGARLVVLVPRESGFVASQPLVAVVLALFFGVAFLLIALLMRNLQRRVATMLEAARRIGQGDFEQEVPVEGSDEIAGLALEFNKMSDRLSRQMGQLKRQREELDGSVQRIGEAFASGLDRGALLEIVLETATAACDAEGGSVVLHDGLGEPAISSGEAAASLGAVLADADEAACESRGDGEASRGDRHAISHAMVDRTLRDSVLCTLTVARVGEPFNEHERGILRYLIGQTQISVENIGLHERVAEQAVTDELTGIPNHRHFSEWLEREIARVERFGGELSLVLIDIDNFKAVNDTYGHLQGDRVLETIGRTLRMQSREIDETARYGGEEFVLALPETDSDGAVEVAERLRKRIAAATVPNVNGGEPISVTASLGVATLPADGDDSRSLIAAADAALYGAKRTGKDKVVSMSTGDVPVPQVIRGVQRS